MHRTQIRQCFTLKGVKGQSQNKSDMTLTYDTSVPMMKLNTKCGLSKFKGTQVISSTRIGIRFS